MKKYLILVAGALALAGCALGPDGQPSGEFKKPQDMTQAEACFNATNVIAVLQKSNVPTLYPNVYQKAMELRDGVCAPAAPSLE